MNDNDNFTIDGIVKMLKLMPGNNIAYKVENAQPTCICFTKGVPGMSGYTSEEYKAFVDPFELILEEDRIVVRDKAVKVLWNDGAPEEDFVFRLTHKTLGFVWVHMAVKYTCKIGDAVIFTASLVDVTKEMLNSQALLEATDRCICVIEKATKRFLYANTSFYDLIDSNPADAMGKHCYELLCKAPEMRTNDNCLCYSCINAKEPIETYNPLKDMYLTMSGREIVWGEYEAYAFYLTDITESKRKDALLEDSQKRFNVALENSDLMIWEYDMVNNLCINSEKAGKDYNIPLIIENYPESLFETGYTPLETIEQIKDVKRRLQNGETGFSVERRTVDKYGRDNWQKVEYSLECDENGKPIRAIVCGLDITAQKELEAKYAEQVAYRNSLAEKAMFSTRLDLTDNKVVDYTCGDKAISTLMNGVSTAEDFSYNFFATSVFDAESGLTREKLMPEELKKYYAAGQNKYHTVYQCTMLNCFLELDLTLSQNPANKHLEAFIMIADATENMLMHTAFHKVVNKDYDFVAVVNVNTGKALFLASADNANPPKNQQYDDIIVGFADAHKDRYYSHEDYLAVSSEMTLANVIEKLKAVPVYEFNCKTLSEDGSSVETYRLSFTYADAIKTQIIFSRANITAAMQEEQQNRHALEAALDAAQRADKAKTEFLSRMSHDMRTPMNGILGITSLLRDRTDPEEISEDVNQIEMSGKYLLSLINDTLDMSKIESGKMELKPQPVNSESLFSNILTTTHILAGPKGVHIKVDFPQIEHGQWVSVMADSASVEQVFINIISNAVKFTPPGGTVTLHMETVEITDDTVTDYYVISDTGIGMSEEFQEHIFEPFSQEGRSNTERESGTGLGLSIVKQIVELMGGTVEIESKLNEGTSVKLRLTYPRCKKKVDVKAESKADLSILNGKHVLLCEDHPVNAQIAVRLLAKQGVTSDRAENGCEGVELFEKSPQGYYAAVLMDIRMPVMDGIDAAKAIRALPREDAARIPIIALTANAFDDDVKKYLDAGMDEHIAKPVEPAKLYQTLAKRIEANKA